MENRSLKHHRERRSEALREQITSLVEGELEDPRIGMVSVNDVQLDPGGKVARIFVAREGDDREIEQCLEALNASRNFIRHALTENLGLRHAPELVFVLDQSERYGNRVEELLHRIEKRKRHN